MWLSIGAGAAEPWKIVNYWSKTCAPCRIEIPELNKLSEELAEFNVQVLGVDFDEHKRDRTLKIAKSMGVKFPTLTLDEVEALALRAPIVLPTTYILDPDSRVVAKLIGAQDSAGLKAQLATLFKTYKPMDSP